MSLVFKHKPVLYAIVSLFFHRLALFWWAHLVHLETPQTQPHLSLRISSVIPESLLWIKNHREDWTERSIDIYEYRICFIIYISERIIPTPLDERWLDWSVSRAMFVTQNDDLFCKLDIKINSTNFSKRQ